LLTTLEYQSDAPGVDVVVAPILRFWECVQGMAA